VVKNLCNNPSSILILRWILTVRNRQHSSDGGNMEPRTGWGRRGGDTVVAVVALGLLSVLRTGANAAASASKLYVSAAIVPKLELPPHHHPTTAPLGRSLHINGVDGTMISFITTTQPRVVKLLDPSPGQDTAVKAVSPGTFIVGRIYLATQPTGGDPTAAASAWFNATWPTIQGLPDIDVWEGAHRRGSSVLLL